MRKIASVLVMSLFALTAIPAGAETNSNVNALLEQVKILQAQIDVLIKAKAELEASQKKVVVAQQDVQSSVKLIHQLRQGMSGDDVKVLQVALAADPDIYPEGLITGYYGPATAKAVKKFQKKHGLDQVGNVGPATLGKINKVLDDNPVATETDGSGKKRPCAIVPPGHLVAKGWLKKQGNVAPTVPECQTLPPGIAKKLGQAPTTTPGTDTAAPVIFNVAVSATTNVGTTITWQTNELATSKVLYATSTPVPTAPGVATASASGLVMTHSVSLTGLSSSTTYFYNIVSTDSSGNTATSSLGNFITGSAAGDSTAPTIFAVGTSAIGSTSATVIWQTNESSDSRVWYATSTPVLSAPNVTSVSVSGGVTSHSVALSGLSSSTTYYYNVVSKDSSGNAATSSVSSFTTIAP